jgi:tetratricopeptide (TPR) repeat protein
MEALGVADPFALARHFAAARPAASAPRVLPFAVAAAREAFRRTAFADAEHWYGVAIALAEEAEISAEERADLYFELGDVVAASGGLVRPRDYYDRASRLARSAGDRRRMALAALGYAHHPQGFGSADPGTVARLREVEALPSGDRALDARVASRLGAELLEAGARHADEAEARLASSLETARELGDDYTLGRVLLNIANVRFSAPDVSTWTALARESARHARAAGDFDTEFRAKQFGVAASLQLGDREQCDAELAACQRIAREHPTRYTRIATRTMEAMFALLDGRLDEARAAVDEADGSESAKEGLGVAARLAAVRFWLGLEAGAAAEPSLDRSTPPQISSHPVLIATAALARAASGDLPEAGRALDAFVAALPRLPYDRSRLAALALAAEVSFRVRAPEHARALQPEVEPFAHLGAVLATASVYVGSMAQALGWIAAAQGRTQEAVEHFRRALRVHESLRSASWVLRSTRAIAEVTRGAVPRRRSPARL